MGPLGGDQVMRVEPPRMWLDALKKTLESSLPSPPEDMVRRTRKWVSLDTESIGI